MTEYFLDENGHCYGITAEGGVSGYSYQPDGDAADMTALDIQAAEAASEGWFSYDPTSAATGQEWHLPDFADAPAQAEAYRRATLNKWEKAAEGAGTVARRAGRKTNRAVYGFLWAVFDVTAFALVWFVYMLTQSPSLVNWILGR